jgi:hypothetical protein
VELSVLCWGRLKKNSEPDAKSTQIRVLLFSYTRKKDFSTNKMTCIKKETKKASTQMDTFPDYYTRSTFPDFKALAETHTRLGLPSTRMRTF